MLTLNKTKKVNVGTLLFLFAYSICLIRVCLGNTTFSAYITMKNPIFIFLLLISMFCILIKIVFYDKYSIRLIFIFLAIVIVFFLSYHYSTYASLFILLFLFLGSKDVDIKVIVKCHFIIYGIIMLSAFLCSMLGIIDNYVTYSTFRGYRYSLGNTYPTDFAAGILYLIFDYTFLKRKRWKIYNSIIVIMIGYIVYKVTDANASYLLICFFSIFMMLLQNKTFNKIFNNKIFRTLLVIAYPVMAAISLGVQYIFMSCNIPLLRKIDLLLNYRLSYGSKAIEQYGIPLFGKYIKFYGNGWGTNTAINTYFYVDNGYLHFALLYGVVLLFIICCGYSYVFSKYKKDKSSNVMLLILIFIAVSAIIEPRFLNVLYNAFIFIIGIEVFKNRVQK